MKKYLKAITLAAVLAAATSGIAKADTINGTISIAGSNTYDANSITFVGAGNIGTNSTSGSLSSFTQCNACVALTSFSFSNFSPTVVFDATEASKSVSLLLNSITSYTSNSAMLEIVGQGVLSATGYDDTPGTFYLSSQAGGTGATVTFSATTIAATPEPGTLMLLGTGLVGSAGALYRRRRTA